MACFTVCVLFYSVTMLEQQLRRVPWLASCVSENAHISLHLLCLVCHMNGRWNGPVYFFLLD